MSLSRIRDDLYVADARGAQQDDRLRQRGITAIVNLGTGLSADDHAWLPEERYLRIPQPDGAPIPDENLDAFLRFMAEQDGPVLVHCAAGVSRSAAFAAAWLMYDEGLRWGQAMARVLRAHPMARPSPMLRRSIVDRLQP